MGRKKHTQKRDRVRVGSVTLALYQHPKGWRFSWKCPETGKWRYGTRATRAEAVTAAHAQALRLQRAAIDLDDAIRDPEIASVLRRAVELHLTHTDLDRLVGTRALPQVTLGAAIDQFLAAKRAARGPSVRNLRTLDSALESLRGHLGAETDLRTIAPAAIETWMGEGNVSPRTSRNRRSVAVTFWRWCRGRQLLPDETTAAERTERPIIRRAVPLTWTPDELRLLLAACPESHRCWLALSAWAGIRGEELYQEYDDSGKDVVRWRDLLEDRQHLEIRPLVAKTGDRRLIPLVAPLRAVLDAEARAHPDRVAANDPICRGRPPSRKLRGINRPVTAILGEAVPGGWRPNALRHSFISYRAAQVGLSRAALEAGNSETEARKSYHDAMPQSLADQWFS